MNKIDYSLFSGELEIIPYCINWINKNIEKKYWENDKVIEKFSKRSANQIIKEGEVFFMSPCLDLTLVAKKIFDDHLDSILVAQEIYSNSYGINSLHFAIEFSANDVDYFIDFSSMNEVIFNRGNFVNHNDDVKSLQMVRSAKKMDHDKNIFENFPEYVSKLKFYDGKKQFGKMLEDNSLSRFHAYKRALGENQELYIVSDLC